MNLCSPISKHQPSVSELFQSMRKFPCNFVYFFRRPLSVLKCAEAWNFLPDYILRSKPKSNDWLICAKWLNYVCVCVWQLNGHYQEWKVKYIYTDLSTLGVNSIRTDQINVFMFLFIEIYSFCAAEIFSIHSTFIFSTPHLCPSGVFNMLIRIRIRIRILLPNFIEHAVDFY